MRKKQEHAVTDKEIGSTKKMEYVLRLFVAGASPNSIRAISNLKELCEQHLQGRYALEIVNVYQQGDLVQKEQIIALPLLVRKFPLPERRLIGNMSNTEKVLKGLGLQV